MNSRKPGLGQRHLAGIALAVGVLVAGNSSAQAQMDGTQYPVANCPTCNQPIRANHSHQSAGTLGYGAPGVYPGFQGFGLGFHRGYGYGGKGLGVGSEGGYPFYGGPGYPHCPPPLKRIGRENPFPYFAGPGYPTPNAPNFFGGVSQLAADQPVVSIIGDPADADYGGVYGNFTGTIPYPESTFAPYTTAAGASGSSSGVSSTSPSNAQPNTAPAPGEMLDEHGADRALGIDVEPVVDSKTSKGLKVTRVYPKSISETAGVKEGDVILSINGYLTELPGHLTWILTKPGASKTLEISVRSSRDDKVHTVTVKLP